MLRWRERIRHRDPELAVTFGLTTVFATAQEVILFQILGHYGAMVCGYAGALIGWWLLSRHPKAPWPVGIEVTFDHPWRATGAALLAAVGVLVLGQLWMRGIRLPEEGGPGPLFGAINQILIFSPMLVLLVVRRESLATAWLAPEKIWFRLVGGVVLALVALTTYTLLRNGADPLPSVIARVIRYDNLDEAAQVFMEDVTIAILLARLSKALGRKGAIALTAVLFSVGHIPALLGGANPIGEIVSLGRDVALGIALLTVLTRSRDIVWFWCVHFVMDISQFPRITGVGS